MSAPGFRVLAGMVTVAMLAPLIVFVLSTGAGAADRPRLLVSGSSNLSDPQPLAGSTVSDDIYVFTSRRRGVLHVKFYVDDPRRQRRPHTVDYTAPFVLGRDGFDSSRLSDGSHKVTAALKLGRRDWKVVTSRFTVSNQAAPSPEPTSEPESVDMKVVSVDPADGATDVPVGKRVRTTFSKAVDPATVTAETYHLLWPNGSRVPGTLSVAADGLSATFDPETNASVDGTTDLDPDKTYRVRASGYKSKTGETGTAFASSFTTGTAVAQPEPESGEMKVVSVDPADGATAVPVGKRVTTTFSKAVDPATVTADTYHLLWPNGSRVPGNLSVAADGLSATFDPETNASVDGTTDLDPNKTYRVRASGYKSKTGETGLAFASSFTTGAAVAQPEPEPTPTEPSPGQMATTLLTDERLQVVRHRWANPPSAYMSDKTAVANDTDRFLANERGSVLKGVNRTTCYSGNDWGGANTGVAPGVPSEVTSRATGSKFTQTKQLQAAAFKALATDGAVLARKVIGALVDQADEPRVQFNQRPFCTIQEDQKRDALFMFGMHMTSKLQAWDNVRGYATDAQKTAVDQWFAEAAGFVLPHLRGRNNFLWTNPYDGSFVPKQGDKSEGEPVYKGGPTLTWYGKKLNNRIGMSSAFLGYYGAMFDHAGAKREARAFAQGAVVSLVGADFFTEMHRSNGTNNWKAISYPTKTASQISLIAAALAADGDRSVLDFTTAKGVGATAGEGSRSVLSMMRMFVAHDKHNPRHYAAGHASTAANIIDWSMNGNNSEGDEAMLFLANYHLGNSGVNAGILGSSSGKLDDSGPWAAFVAPSLQFGPG
ncbi:MAG: Ig-like domain-containing protein [Actinomycetota bacterium]|nr:Ig-like domain-containing protein [Actinomycetota bacterium]